MQKANEQNLIILNYHYKNIFNYYNGRLKNYFIQRRQLIDYLQLFRQQNLSLKWGKNFKTLAHRKRLMECRNCCCE